MSDLLKPSTMSRRGFLRMLGLTTATVFLGDVVQVEEARGDLVSYDIAIGGVCIDGTWYWKEWIRERKVPQVPLHPE